MRPGSKSFKLIVRSDILYLLHQYPSFSPGSHYTRKSPNTSPVVRNTLDNITLVPIYDKMPKKHLHCDYKNILFPEDEQQP